MADAPIDGLYEPFVDAVVDGDRLEVLGERFGPAGISAVELPDGSIWEVDHLDPGRLIGLEVDAADPAGSPLLIVAFGGDGAMRLADRTRTLDQTGSEPRDEPQHLWGRRNLPEPAANAAGRIVLLADLAQDASIDPLARILSVVETAARTRRTPGGDLFEPLLPGLVDMADSLAADIDPIDLPQIDPQGKALISAIDLFLARFSDRAPMAADLLQELLIAGQHDWDIALDMLQVADADDLPYLEQAAAMSAPAPTQGPEDFLGLDRITPSLLEVTVARSGDERWIRVLRRDGLVLLAQAPLERGGLMDRAELLIPPDTPDHEIEVQIVDADQLTNLRHRPTDLIRRAVRAGRAAASAERRRDIRRAMHRWNECAELWSEAGDRERWSLAIDRTTTSGGQFRGEPLLLDDLDPYGDLEP